MKKAKLFKLFTVNSSSTLSYLTKNEIILISVLSITSSYVIKMEMLLVENNPLSSPTALIENTVTQHDRGNVQQSIMMHEKSTHHTPGNLNFKVELAQINFMEREYTKAKVLAEQILIEKDWSSPLSLDSL